MTSTVLFDHDGVLVDTERWYFEAGRRVLADVGVDLDEARYVQDMASGLGTWHQARQAGLEDTAVDRLRVRRDALYRELLLTRPIEIPGVVETLERLHGRVRMAVVTTATRADVEVIHEHRDLLSFMELVLVREDYDRAKPHPEPYLTALDRLGVEPGDALVVEDSARGLRSAVAAGIDCAVVDHPFTAAQDLSAATYRIGALRELPGLLGLG